MCRRHKMWVEQSYFETYLVPDGTRFIISIYFLPTFNPCWDLKIKFNQALSQTVQNHHSMNVEQVRQICIAMKGVTEGFPFDEVTLVLKVGGKMFALLNLDKDPSVNLKCDPERLTLLRSYPEGVKCD